MLGKLKKVFRMSPGEILFRIGEQIRIRREKANARKELKEVSSPEFNFFEKGHADWFEMYRSSGVLKLWEDKAFCRKLAAPLDEEKKERFWRDYRREAEESLARADKFLEHKFSFLGVSFTLPDPIPWQSDPLSLTPYPQGFYRDIDIFTNKNAGDIKHVWEVNRLQFLIELAKAAWLSGEEKYSEKLEEWLLDWIDKNPYKQGVAWASALEVGVRVTALVWTLEFYRATEKPKPYVMAAMLKLIYLSGSYLYENLSIYFSPYNHLIGEAAGLFLAGYLFPGFRDARKWEKRAWQVLTDQIEKQFHSDGASVEQASFYHHFTLGFYLQAVAVKKLNGQNVPIPMTDRMEKALEFAMYIHKPDGDMPHLGDIDDARSIYFGDPTHWNFDAWRAMGAVWFKRPDLKFGLSRLPEEAFWLLGEEDIRAYRALREATPQNTGVWLKESGYAIFRNHYNEDGHYVHMDCGPIAHGVYYDDTPSAAHGHADELALELACFGESHLVDPGFSNYRGDFNWHSYFRSTASHNTIEINNRSQARQGGILVWSRAPRYKQLAFVNGKRLKAFCGEHYGYHRQPGAPVHRRYMAFIDDSFWLVWDHIYPGEGKGQTITIADHYHFNSGLKVETGREGRIESSGEKSRLTIALADGLEEPFDISLKEGDDGPDGGWISPTYRAVRPAPLVCVKREIHPPYNLLKVMLPEEKNGGRKTRVEKAGTGFDIGMGDAVYRVRLSTEPAFRVTVEGEGQIFELNSASGEELIRETRTAAPVTETE